MSWPDPNAIASQSEFARMIGISQQAVSKLQGNGIIEKGQTYDAWLNAYLERLRSEAAGRLQDERLSSARIRETEMNANLKEIEFHDKLKNIIWRDDLLPLLDALVSSVQFNVMSAKERIIEAIESKHSITLDDESVSEPLRSALESVASSKGELARMLHGFVEELGTESTSTNS